MAEPRLAWSREESAAVAEVRESEDEERWRRDWVGCVGPVRRVECGSELGRLVLVVLVEEAEALEAALAVWARSRESSRVRRLTCGRERESWLALRNELGQLGLGCSGMMWGGEREREIGLVESSSTYNSFLLFLHFTIEFRCSPRLWMPYWNATAVTAHARM